MRLESRIKQSIYPVRDGFKQFNIGNYYLDFKEILI